MFRAWLAGLTVWCCLHAPAHAQTVLTFQEIVARAREAGIVAVARARIPEAEAALLDASARFRENPIVEVGAGPRYGGGNRTNDVDVSIAQPFETGGQRQARIDGATAGIERLRAEVDRVALEAVRQATSAFLDGLAASERLMIAEEADSVSRQLLAATERRYAAGDIAAIDLNLARIEAARSAAALRASRADLTMAVGILRTMLRLPPEEPVELQGSLDPPAVPPMAEIEAMIERRPDLAILRADVREAEAQAQLGRALRRPDLGLRVSYEHEDSDSVVLGGLTVTIPAFQRGRSLQAGGLARATRARLEFETTRETALAELRAAYIVHGQRAELAAALVRDALGSVADNENLARRSYEAGEMNLLDLLLIRRDGLETRTSVVDRRLDAARSRLDVDFLAGALR